MTSLRLAFAGTPDIAADILASLCRGPHQVVGVLSQPDRPSGRGRKLVPTPVSKVATANGLSLAQPERLDAAGRAVLAAWAPDLLVVVAYGLLLSKRVLATPRLGCLNVHASLLPRWRGAAPVERAIMAGDSETGVCIMQMDPGLDTGPVFLARRCAISANSTGDSVLAELTELGGSALAEVLDQLARTPPLLQPQPQSDQGVSYAHKLSAADAELLWHRDAIDLERQVRALYSRMPAFTWLPAADGRPAERMKVHAATLSGSDQLGQTETAAAPGTILASDRRGVVVACGSGALTLTRVQVPRGKGKAMAVADLHNGWPDLLATGTVLATTQERNTPS